ncbi:MAG TPA: bifunctional helix-turn-helix transcriptional regulator/GNAT family N-acetyltransferase [Caulobacteraceae bacterium]|nr:bifunctional helix-turn-helix transcriptional regulator/GNAT family N-acetyltransferase [Caulobacteraceae bacterium]
MEDAIAAVRLFNRFYTRRVGALNQRFLGAELTLPEARLMFEIEHAEAPVASELNRLLGMDAGYTSRVLARFEARGWITRETGEGDQRPRPIVLTPAGRAVFDLIDQRQRDEVREMLRPLAAAQQADLVAALGEARTLLDPTPDRSFSIRPLRTGDLGLMTARQSAFYREAYGWGRGIEINIADTAAGFLRNYKDGRDNGWIAEVAGAMAGSVLITDEGGGLSRLRLLYVEPMARGRGIGDHLVELCLSFAREVGYTAMTLWTHTVLTSARRIYAANGFEIVAVETHDEFGEPVQSETWRIEL